MARLGGSLILLSLAACGAGDGAAEIQSQVSSPVEVPRSEGAPTEEPSPAPATVLVWSDEFDGGAGAGLSATRWTPMNRGGGFGNKELEAYTPRPENVSLDGQGALRIVARAEDYVDPLGNKVEFTSGRVETIPGFLYGRVEARIKVPSGKGLWSAFWMIGQETLTRQWPKVGEIDVMEFIDDARTVYANVHANTVDEGVWSAQGQRDSDVSYGADWHIYSVDWTRDSLVFAVDGVSYHVVEKSKIDPTYVWAFDQPQHLVLNLAVGGTWAQQPTDPSAFPAEMLVDYVRVYNSEVT